MTTMPSGRAHYCRMCEAEMVPDDNYCPHCGTYGKTSKTDPVEVSAKDVVRSVFMAFVALVLTAMVSWRPIQRLLIGGWNRDRADALIAAGFWNFYILGLPVVFIARGWYTRVRRGEFNHAWIWRDYWFVQLIVLSPFIALPIPFMVIWIISSMMIVLLR